MMIKNYTQFIKESSGFKKAIVSGIMAATLLSGCGDVDNTQSSIGISQNTASDVLSNSFKMDQKVLTVGTDMSISTGGRVEERSLNWGTTFEYFNGSGVKKATAKEKVFSLATTIEIFDENDSKLGEVREEISKGLFSTKSFYTIKDSQGNLIGESEMADWLSTDLDIKDSKGNVICSMSRPAINLLSDTWTVKVYGDFDKRLIVFIPCYKTSADDKRKSDDDK